MNKNQKIEAIQKALLKKSSMNQMIVEKYWQKMSDRLESGKKLTAFESLKIDVNYERLCK